MAKDWEDAPSSDGWEDAPDKDSFADKALGVLDAGAAMFAGTPAQIAGGLHGLSTLVAGQGLDKANENMQKTQKANFGFGEYKPMTKKGGEYAENVTSTLEKPVEWAGDLGEKIAGNEGRLAGELWTRSAMELIDPTVLLGVGGKAIGRKVGDREGRKLAEAKKAQDALQWEDAPDSPTAAVTDPENPFKETQLDPIQQEVARLRDKDILRQLQEIDAQVTAEERRTRDTSAVADETLYADPQNQVFKGDPNEAGAVEALRSQTAAMDMELTHLQGKGTPEGSPLRPLTDPTRHPATVESSRNVFDEGFESIKTLDNGMELRAYKDRNGFNIEAKRGDMVVGNVTFDKNGQAIEAFSVKSTEPGTATEMYRYAAELGNDIIKSNTQTKAGEKMWQSFERRGIAKGGRISKQSGSIDPKLLAGIAAGAGITLLATSGAVDPHDVVVGTAVGAGLLAGNIATKRINKIMKKQDDGTFIPKDPTPEELKATIEKSYSEKDGKSATYMDSGATLTAMKRGSTIIRLAGDLVQGAFKRADLAIREHVFPVEKLLKDLSKSELTVLGGILKQEMMVGKRADPEKLSHLPAKMAVAYKKMRELLDDTLRIQNEAREARGQKPITALEAYLSSRWQGDFRRPLYNKDGKLVWYLASDTKMGLDAQTRAVLKDNPELTYDPKKDHTVRFWNRKTDLESAYTTMIDILGRDDPAVEKLAQYVEDQTAARGASFLNQEKHFKKKGNVRGFIGDRPELTLNDFTDRHIPGGDHVKVTSKDNDMLDMFQQQIQYAKNAYRWSELQKAGQSIKKIISDPTLTELQPNNVKYIKEYFKNAIGYGENAWARMTADTMRSLGVSPAPLDKGVSNVKSFFILQKLAANTGYTLANIVQLSMTLPHLMDLRHKGYKGNVGTAAVAGMLGGLLMGSGHLYNGWKGSGAFGDIKGADFFNRAFKYAEDNGVTARSIYDESPIADSFSKTAAVGNILGKTMTIPETYVRSAAFMMYAQFLKDSGKFTNEADLFREAEARTNVSMVDYASTERPMVFSKLGFVGNFLNTLQTYSWNFYNQFSYFAREAKRGNYMPMVTFLTTMYMVAGAQGIPGAEDLYKLLMKSKEWLPAGAWKQVQDNEFLADPKLWLLKNAGSSTVYGYLSDKTGLGLTTRVAAPSAGQMLQSPAGPVTDIAKQIGSAASAVADPTNATKWGQVAMNSAPPGLQGLLETAPFMEGITHNKRQTQDGGTETIYNRPTRLAEREGLLVRTPDEETARKWGLRKQSEIVKRDVGYATKRDTMQANEHAKNLPDAFYDAVRRSDTKKAVEYAQTYTYITGKKFTQEQFESRMEKEFMTDIERQSKNAKRSVQAIINIKRMQEVLDAVEKENEGKTN
jgi:hypothetical protein